MEEMKEGRKRRERRKEKRKDGRKEGEGEGEGGMVGGKERRRWKGREGGKEDKGGAGIIYFICTNVDLQDMGNVCSGIHELVLMWQSYDPYNILYHMMIM